jgi:hypothetical protein
MGVLGLYDKREIRRNIEELQSRFPTVEKKKIEWKYARQLLEMHSSASKEMAKDPKVRGYIREIAKNIVRSELEKEKRNQ